MPITNSIFRYSSPINGKDPSGFFPACPIGYSPAPMRWIVYPFMQTINHVDLCSDSWNNSDVPAAGQPFRVDVINNILRNAGSEIDGTAKMQCPDMVSGLSSLQWPRAVTIDTYEIYIVYMYVGRCSRRRYVRIQIKFNA